MTKAELLTSKYKELLNEYEINTPIRLRHFWAQLSAESNLNSSRESCYYKTIESLRNTFKTPFKGKSDQFVSQYLKNTEKCSNYVYANRGGNGDEKTGDGFKFRGGGMLMNTFKDGFKNLKVKTGIDFVSDPNLILEEKNAILSALVFWKDNKLNQYADKDDLDSISDIVNIGTKTKAIGDANGYAHRKEFLEKYKQIFK